MMFSTRLPSMAMMILKHDPLFYRFDPSFGYFANGFVKHPQGIIFFYDFTLTDHLTSQPVIEKWDSFYFIYWKRSWNEHTQYVFALVSTKEAAEEIASWNQWPQNQEGVLSEIPFQERYQSFADIKIQTPWTR